MTEINTNIEEKEALPLKQVTFWNNPATRFHIFTTVPILILCLYFFWWVPRQKCESDVTFNPAGTVSSGGPFDTSSSKSFNKESYYEYSYKKFESKADAISYCTRNK